MAVALYFAANCLLRFCVSRRGLGCRLLFPKAEHAGDQMALPRQRVPLDPTLEIAGRPAHFGFGDAPPSHRDIGVTILLPRDRTSEQHYARNHVASRRNWCKGGDTKVSPRHSSAETPAPRFPQ